MSGSIFERKSYEGEPAVREERAADLDDRPATERVVRQESKASLEEKPVASGNESVTAEPKQPTTGPDDEASRYNTLLGSISRGDPGGVLPLLPPIDTDCGACDRNVEALVESLTPQFALFLVTALLLEQPVLLVVSPGGEERMVRVQTALLRLLRPLRWSHTYIPLLTDSCAHVLRHAIESCVPFLIGTYPAVLDQMCPAALRGQPLASPINGAGSIGGGATSSRSGGSSGGNSFSHAPARHFDHSPAPESVPTPLLQTQNVFDSSGGAGGMGGSGPLNLAGGGPNFVLPTLRTSHVTIVDLDQSIIHPSRVLEYAAAVTMHTTYAPDGDNGLRPLQFPLLMRKKDQSYGGRRSSLGSGSQSFSAALQASVGGMAARGDFGGDVSIPGMLPALPARYRHRLGKNMEEATANAAASVPRAGAAAHAITNSVSVSAEVLRSNLFGVLVSLLKPYHLFLRPPTMPARPPCAADFDADGLLAFSKDDIRPFLRCLLHTSSFETFLAGSAPSSRQVSTESQPGSPLITPRSVESLMTSPVQLGQTPAMASAASSMTSLIGTHLVGHSRPPSRLLSEGSSQPVSTSATAGGGGGSFSMSVATNNSMEEVIKREVRKGVSENPSLFTYAKDRSGSASGSNSSNMFATRSNVHSGSGGVAASGGSFPGRPGPTIVPGSASREEFEEEIRKRMTFKLEALHRTLQTNDGRLSVWIYASLSQQSIGGSPSVPTESPQVRGTSMTTPPPTQRPSMTSNLRSGTGVTKHPKMKKRWCILDATKISYFKSRSQKRVKGFIPFDPSTVTLVLPLFTVRGAGAVTTDQDCVALIWNDPGPPSEVRSLHLSAVDVPSHIDLVKMLRAKLLPRDLLLRMELLYGGGRREEPSSQIHRWPTTPEDTPPGPTSKDLEFLAEGHV